jgi:hypothetical protein
MSYIGRLQSVSFDMYRAPSPLGFIMQSDSTLDLIGFIDSDWVGIALIASPHLVTHSVLVLGLSVGRARRRMPFLYLQPRQSTEG